MMNPIPTTPKNLDDDREAKAVEWRRVTAELIELIGHGRATFSSHGIKVSRTPFVGNYVFQVPADFFAATKIALDIGGWKLSSGAIYEDAGGDSTPPDDWVADDDKDDDLGSADPAPEVNPDVTPPNMGRANSEEEEEFRSW